MIGVGRLIKRGRNQLLIRTRAGAKADYDVSRFHAVRWRPEFLSLTAHVRTKPGRIAVRTMIDGEADGFSARLNGRPVKRRLSLAGNTVRKGLLDVDDGLRYGRNRLVVSAFRKGRFDREVFTFTVTRNRPLIGAGDDQVTTAGLPVRLDATASRARTSGGALAYRWKLIRAPDESSGGALRGASRPRPAFTPDVNGRYTIRLRAHESVGPGGGTGADQVTIITQLDAPPIGVPIATIPQQGGITISGETIVSGGQWIQMAVLERDTLAVNGALTGTYEFTDSDLSRFTSAISKVRAPTATDAGELVVVTGANNQPDDTDLPANWVSALESAYKQLGGTLRPFIQTTGDEDPGFGCGQWSLIGIKGTDEGQAAQQQQFCLANGLPGNLVGYLQLDSLQRYGFVSNQYIPFDTDVFRAPPNTVRVQIGSSTSFVNESFTSDALAAGESGFYVLALDQATLQKLSDFTVATNQGFDQIVSGVNDLNAHLATLAGTVSPALVIIQSIGTPSAEDPSWLGLTPLIKALGGTPGVFNYPAKIMGAGGYTLVGGVNLSGFGTEQSSAVTGHLNQSSQLTGVLKLNRQSQWVGDLSDPTGYANPAELLAIISQPDQDWPVPAPGNTGQMAAMEYIASEISPGAPFVDRSDVRPNYWLEALGVSWDTSLLTAIPPPPASSGVTREDFDAVIAQLMIEFPVVKALNDYYDGLQTAVLGGTILSEGLLASIGSDIAQAVEPPPPKTSSFDEFFDIFTIATRVAGSFVPFPGGAPLAAMSGAMQIIGIVDTSPAGNNNLSQQVEADTATLEADVAETAIGVFENLDQVYSLLVSDWGRLQAAGQKVNEWNVAKVLNGYEVMFSKSYEQYFYNSLMGLAYQGYKMIGTTDVAECISVGPGDAGGQLFPGVVSPWGWDTFFDTNQPDDEYSSISLNTGFTWESGSGGAPSAEIFSVGEVPPADLMNPMFNPASTDDLGQPNWAGLYPQFFYEQAISNPTPVDCLVLG